MKNNLFRSIVAAAALWAASMIPAFAQTSPNWSYGFVPTPAQWNAEWASKQNTLGYTPLNSAGGIMSGRLVTAAPGASLSGFNLTPGSTPPSPNDGDLWATTSGLFVRINGVTVGPLVSTATVSLTVGSTLITSGTSTRVLNNTAGVLGEYSITGTGNVAMSASPTFSGTIAAANANFNGIISIASSASTCFTLGPGGVVNPVLQVDCSTGTQAAGLKLTGAVAAGNVDLSVISSGSAANLSINAKGTGTILVGNISTGSITLSRATTLSAALTYGGITLSNAVTGTGNMVLATSPTLSGNITMTLGSDATGDVYYRNSSGFVTRLPIGGASNILTVAGGLPSWAAATGGGNVSTSGSPAAFQTPVWASGTTIKGIGPGTLGQQWTSGGAGVDPSFTSGGWVLLNTLPASASATLADTTSFTASYNEYEIVFQNVLPATNNSQCQLQVNSGGVQTTSYSAPGIVFAGTASSVATSNTFIGCSNVAAADVGNTSGGVSGSFRVSTPSAAVIKGWVGNFTYLNSGSTSSLSVNTAGQWLGGTGAITGFQMKFSAGNIASGTIKIYGRL